MNYVNFDASLQTHHYLILMECQLNIGRCTKIEALRDDNNGKANKGEKKKGYCAAKRLMEKAVAWFDLS